MAKRFRVALAMGGGTSQGTFSGVALTEALKLLVLYGSGGRPCESLVIDAASGASAGSVTLAILLRSLLTPLRDPAGVDSRSPDLRPSGNVRSRRLSRRSDGEVKA